MQEPDKTPEVLKLESQLRETVAAEQLLESQAGRLLVDLLTLEINQGIQRITGDTYLKDHAGYVHALAEINVAKRLLRRIQVAASPVRREKILQKLGEK